MSYSLFPTPVPSSPSSSLCPDNPNTSPHCNNIALDRDYLGSSLQSPFTNLERDYMGIGLGSATPAEIIVDYNSTPTVDLCGNHLKLAPPSNPCVNHGEDAGEPLSGSIGWPPISSYRKTTTRSLSIKPACRERVALTLAPNVPLNDLNTFDMINEASSKIPLPIMKPLAPNYLTTKPLRIKVSMDGTPIMRKLDLKSMQGYHHLSMELHKLFKFYKSSLFDEVGVPSYSKDFDGTQFILTYKDREGDWMLVGDTPWETFSKFARRIRIMKKVK